MYIKINIFKEQWKRLKRNYRDKDHTENDGNEYYLNLKDLSDEEFIDAITKVIQENRYFPNVAEIRMKVNKKNLEKWENVQQEPLDKKDKEWARNFYKKYCDTEEEYQERIKKYELED